MVEIISPIVETFDCQSGSVSFFELTTAMAVLHFDRNNCDAMILEVGLGGRLDSTNVCASTLAAITSIGLDHQRVLGDTIGDCALARARWAVDGNYRRLALCMVRTTHETVSACTRMPTDCANSTKPGNEVATLAQFSILIAPSARSAAMGGAFTALAKGVEASRYNPANLGLTDYRQNGLELISIGASINNNSFSLADYNNYDEVPGPANAVAVFDDGGFVVAWQRREWPIVRLFDAAGDPVGLDYKICEDGTGILPALTVAPDDGSFVVTGGCPKLRRFDRNRVEIQVDWGNAYTGNMLRNDVGMGGEMELARSTFSASQYLLPGSGYLLSEMLAAALRLETLYGGFGFGTATALIGTSSATSRRTRQPAL